MRRILVLLFFVVAMVVWCTPGFAVQTVNPPGDTLSATGVSQGVFMNDGGLADLLTVGEQDIFTNNKASEGVATDKTLSAVYTTNSAKSSITITGNSTVYGRISGIDPAGEKTFVLITAGASGNTVNFLGRVNATEVDIGTGTVNFKSGASNDAATVITGVGGTLGLAANTTVVGALTTTAGDNTGTLSLATGSQLTGQVGAGAAKISTINVVGGTNTAGVRADIVGAVFTHQFSLLTNHLAIDGAFTIATAGTFNTTLAGTSLAQYGHITATGAANIGTGNLVKVTVPSGTYIPLGTLFDIVNATGAITADIIPTITTVGDTNPLYTFVVEPITGTAAGKLTIKTTGTPVQPANPVADPVAAAVSPALGTLPAASPVITAINALTTAAAVASAEAQLAPSTASLASPLLTYQGVRQFQTLWLNRLDACGQVSWPSENKENCKGSTADNGWWLKGFGYFGQQDSRSGFTSYDARILGSMIAYDRSLGLNTRAGVGLGYARTNIKGTVYDANTESDTYRAVAYIGHELGSWFFDGSGSFGWNEYRDRRHVEFPGMDTTAKSKYNGQDYTVFGRAGYHLPAIHEFIITPMASLQYTRVNIDGRTEKGSTDDINMRVRSQHYDYLESGLGGKVERPFNYNSKFTFVPEAHFEWLHKLSNPRIKQTAVYIDSGTAFTTPSLRTVADSYHAGVGLNLLSCACSATVWSIETGYDYYWRTDGYAANQVSMRVSRRF